MIAIRSYQLRVTTNGYTPTLHATLLHISIYYASIVAVLALCITSTFIPYLNQPIIASDFIIFALSITCTRLILSLRGTVAHLHHPDGTTTPSSSRENRRTNRSSFQLSITVPHTEEAGPSASPGKVHVMYGLCLGVKNGLRWASVSECPNSDRVTQRGRDVRRDPGAQIGRFDFEALVGSVETLSLRTLSSPGGAVADIGEERVTLSRIDSGVHESVYCWPTPPSRTRTRTPSRTLSRTDARPHVSPK